MSHQSISIAFVAVALLAATLCCVVEAFNIRPNRISVIGRAPVGKYFWRPHGGVRLSNDTAIVKVVTSAHGCEFDRSCTFALVYTADGGETWHVSKTNYPRYCGLSGIVTEDGWLHCVGAEIKPDNDPLALTFGEVRYKVTAEDGIIEEETSHQIKFDQKKFISPPVSLRMGDTALDMRKDHKVLLRNAEVTLANGTVTHALFKATIADDDTMGRAFVLQSYIPQEFGDHNTLQRIGDTRIVVVSGAAFDMNQSSSLYLGTQWEKPARSSFNLPVSWHTSEYYVSVTSGVAGWPGIQANAIGAKRSSDRTINIAEFHNRVAGKTNAMLEGVRNYTKDYLDNKKDFECLAKDDWGQVMASPPEGSNWGKAGCESSSHVSIVPLGSDLFAFYDQLGNGFNEAKTDTVDEKNEEDAGQGQTVYAMRLHLNETKERTEHEERIKQEEQRKATEKIQEEARKKAEAELKEKQKEERRARIRRTKERRADYEKINAGYIEKAQKYADEDGEMVVVRDVDPDWADMEKEL